MAFAGVLLLAAVAYWPGLAGGFLFDDFVNLPALGKWGRIDDADAFWRYITSGNADPTGRPISLLTFLFDARNWPADPAPFLRTNLLLHLLNGTLLFRLLLMLERRLGASLDRGLAVATLGAGLWTLHPLFVSTTLYIVQREAMLPATFTLLGLIAWVHGRERIARGAPYAHLWLLVVFGLCTVLSVLSKANGILLPVLAWVVDATVLRPRDTSDSWNTRTSRALRTALLILPSLFVIAYVLWGLRHLGEPFSHRSWTLGERLLTEPRVILDYLQLLMVPRVLSTGLYNDAYEVSSGLLQPLSTLPALLAVVGLAIGGCRLRHRAPALATALLFFLAGHLLESSTIALELYFEHRNYLPAMLLGWPLARAIAGLKMSRGVRVAAGAALLALLAIVTWQRAGLWAQQERMAYLWAAKNPASSRAQATAAIFETRSGRPESALARLDALAERNPGDLQLVLNRLNAKCGTGGLDKADIDAVSAALRYATEGDQLLHRWFERSLAVAQDGRCAGFDLDAVSQWLDAAFANPRIRDIAGRQQDLHSIAGQLAIARGTPSQALPAFNRALDALPSPQVALHQAGLLATHGCLRDALAHLDRYDTMAHRANGAPRLNMEYLHQRVLLAQGYWREAVAHQRAAIETDLAQGGMSCR